MFASFSRYKHEAYRHSEYAPRILYNNGLRVIMKVLTRIFYIYYYIILFLRIGLQSDRKSIKLQSSSRYTQADLHTFIDPAIISRYLLHEAQQAHYYGLPSHVALSSVISTPAEVLGLDHRIGYIREGFDAGENYSLF